jgi:MbtH protein
MDVNADTYAVVLNDEEQYSIWPAGRELPAGWRRSGFTGAREACLAHIDEVWTDIRPLSLRRAIVEQTRTAS